MRLDASNQRFAWTTFWSARFERAPTSALRPLAAADVDLRRLHQLLHDRLLPAADKLARDKIPVEASARAAVERMVTLATDLKAPSVQPRHLLHALIDDETGAVAQMLIAVGADLGRLRAELLQFR